MWLVAKLAVNNYQLIIFAQNIMSPGEQRSIHAWPSRVRENWSEKIWSKMNDFQYEKSFSIQALGQQIGQPTDEPTDELRVGLILSDWNSWTRLNQTD